MEQEHKSTVGDILFYWGRGSFTDWIISTVERSPIVHTAIDLGTGFCVEANGKDIAQRAINTRPYIRWSYVKHATDVDMKDMDAAIKWLRSMIGQPYGFSDILTAAN